MWGNILGNVKAMAAEIIDTVDSAVTEGIDSAVPPVDAPTPEPAHGKSISSFADTVLGDSEEPATQEEPPQKAVQDFSLASPQWDTVALDDSEPSPSLRRAQRELAALRQHAKAVEEASTCSCIVLFIIIFF